ncbi:vWA domain-containing protein [Pararhizobium antarcticum]|uniref:VWFA domain-containing protein n=1 Tax=Pararhizobium antarcticum TaxID=1798805 RepID=A0A657LUX8_9HYPH|nr:VWA domain-containing protein [Pararhizobium antarcticum]OJF91936.1 hypothetical protein AX761_05455 [Rhizobium sp. 58]OJF98319.1 hypothetical protein AX760_14515 [Pararhizobium antarcticum]
MIMTDELDRLSKTATPAASADARARAVAAAMQAFDAQDAGKEKFSTAPQGKQNGWRQSSIINWIWSPIMNRKLLAGSALATLLVVPAAAFLTLELTRGNLPVGKPDLEIAGDVLPTENPKIGDEAAADAAKTKAVPLEQETAVKPTDLTGEPVGMLLKENNPSEDAGRSSDGKKLAPIADGAASGVQPQRAESQSVDAAAPVGTLTRTRQVTTMMQEAMPAPSLLPDGLLPQPEKSGDRFSSEDNNPVKSVASDPVSTFSADVDTASYAFVRKALLAGGLPDKDSVRVEEMVNYFPYDWPGPETDAAPFKATVKLLPTPWNPNTRLMHIGIKGYDVLPAAAPRANLVFLIDVSGSMEERDKLPLLKSAFRLLVEKLKPDDTVSIVTYAGNAGTVLEPTKVKDKQTILSAIDTLQPGGATAGAQGIEAAYALAQSGFAKDGVNRILLATDGDFNVGPASDDALKAVIEEKRKAGIFLSVLGFGRGNYNDALMQTLAQNGNGIAAYIDTLAEAQKALVEEAGSQLFPIARDVKFQVEFNPTQIAEYRLIGYETRALKREDFNNDRVDAGDIGSGHRVTAIYEVTPKGSPAVLNDDLRYQAGKTSEEAAVAPGKGGELAFLKIRYKQPDSDTSRLITTPVTEENAVTSLDAAGADARFSVAVAAFGQKLRGTDAVAAYAYDAILELAAGARGDDPYSYRAEFLNLVRLAKSLSGE